jgi:RHS repeat-associated protein
MRVWIRLFAAGVLLCVAHSVCAVESAGLARQGKPPSLVATAAVTTPHVYRCKTESKFNSYGCVSALPSPFDASAFDFGIGGYTSLNGVVQVYKFRFTPPGSTSGYTFTYTLRPATSSTCPNGYVSNDGLTSYCFYDGVYQLVKIWRRVGQWKLELLADDVVQWTAYSNVKAGEIRQVSGNGASAPINEPIRTKPRFALYHFDNTTVDISESRSSSSSDIVTFNITGPNKASGMSVSSPTYPDNETSEEILVVLGNKIGTYTVKGTMTGATMPSPFTFSAVARQEGPDHPNEEEGNGDDCGKVGDPITIGLGNSFQQATDYPRTGVSILEFSRAYNAFGSKSRLMRNYWTTTYDRFVILPPSAGMPAKVRRPDGRTLNFDDVSGVFSPRAYFEVGLVKTATGWKFTDRDQTVELFDAQGRLLSITAPTGASVATAYDSAGKLTKVTANTGESLTFAYSATGQVSSVSDNGGRVWTYSYDGYSNLRNVTSPDKHYTNYYYQDAISPFLLTAAGSNDGGDSLRTDVYWEHDSLGRVTANYLRGGHKRVDIVYLPDGSRTVTDSLGRVTTYRTRTINGRGFVDGAIGPGYASCGLADSELMYDADMNVTARTSFGRRTEYGNFDSKGQPAFLIEAAGTLNARRTDYAYDSRFVDKPTSVTSPSVSPGRSKVVTYSYNTSGDILTHSIAGFRPDGTPVSRNIAYQYNGPLGQLSQIDGPRTDVADVIQFQYDATSKRLLRVVDADGVVVRDKLTYTPHGQLASEERPNGLKLTYAYRAGTNLLTTLTETQGTATRTTNWTYNSKRQVASITYVDGVNTDYQIAFRYDNRGELNQMSIPGTDYAPHPNTGAYTVSVDYTFDTEGNVTRQVIGNAHGWETKWLSRTFDIYNRIDKLIHPTGTIDYDYHPDGTLTQVTDGNQRVTAYQYDDFKRLTRVVQPGQLITVYGYDVQDNLIQLTDANSATTRYVVDDLGNRLRLESPDSGTTVYSHDSAGNVVQSIDAKGQATTRTFSAGGRLLSVDRAGVFEDETYSYDNCRNGVGKLCAVSSGNGEYVAYEYDGFGRVALVVTRNGGLAYTYDARDNVASITYPSGRRVRYTRNSAGQVTQVALDDGLRSYTLASNIKNLPFGPARQWTYGNGLVETREYNAQYLPVSLGVPGKFSMTFPQYDPAANLLQRVVDGQTENYGYDALNRLQSASGPFGVRSYSYDAVGNRTQGIADGVVTTSNYAAESNRLLGDSQWSYQLDANGNRTQRSDSAGLGQDYVYTPRNQLNSVAAIGAPGGDTAVYAYNALGQRTVKAINGDERLFTYGLDGKLLSEALGDGSIVEEYVYLNGQPLALLGAPYHAPTPPVVEAIVDDVAHGSFTTKNSQNAYGGSYQTLSVASPYSTYAWNWAVPLSGYYDIWVWWMRRANDGRFTLYSMGGPNSPVWVDHSQQTLGAWTYLGRHHLSVGSTPLWLEEKRHSDEASPDGSSLSGGSLAVDAARFKLIEQDTGEEGDYRYVIVDQIGTPQAATDRSGNLVWRAVYDPFGAAAVDSDPDGDGAHTVLNLRFAGQYFDAETGLHDNYFRSYSPEGRYLQSDPIGLVGGVNTYAYVRSNPLTAIDPLGLATCTYTISTGTLSCVPDNIIRMPITIPVAAGNNGGGMACKNNPYCTSTPNRGPIPQGDWRWDNSALTGKPNGRVLVPQDGTETYGRSQFRTHSCLNAFGPSTQSPFCSEGCITGSASDIKLLNTLLDAEPNSTLHVISSPPVESGPYSLPVYGGN